MAIDTLAGVQSTQAGSVNAQADQLLSRTRTALSASTPSSREDAKIEKAGKDFESILLGSWLQQAEQSFAKVPGGDGTDDGRLEQRSIPGYCNAGAGGISNCLRRYRYREDDHKTLAFRRRRL